jgi:hypothetical protein
MTPTTNNGKKDISRALKALQRSAKRALVIGLTTGTPVYVMENRRIVDLTKRAKSRRIQESKHKK